MAEILHWLVLRFDPNFDLSLTIDTESDRVLFIRTVVQHLAAKENIRLDTKKLYEADGNAVQELLKAVTVLYEASKSIQTQDQEEEEEQGPLNESLVRARLSEFKRSREVAAEITSRGANLYDELGKEIQLRVIIASQV